MLFRSHGRIEEASFARYRRKRGDGEGRASKSHEKGVSVNAYLCEVVRLSPPQEFKRDRTWFPVEEARRRLREGRKNDAEMVRVVDKAVARILQLRGRIGIEDERAQDERGQDDRLRQDRTLHRDALQKVQFEAFAEGYRVGRGRSVALSVQQFSATRQPIAPEVEVHARKILQGEVLQFGPAREEKSATKNG